MDEDTSKYPLQALLSIAEICAQRGVQHAVISPGSRSAPLMLSFVRHPHIRTYLLPDERAAAFVALGMAQTLGMPVALICTSGSAAYNYAPAVAEAFFEAVPLLILTADRPPEWIDQRDGQTIRQEGIYGRHVKGSWQMPVDYQHFDARWHIQALTNRAITAALDAPMGPVHLNVPLREPFYPKEQQQFWSERAPRVSQYVGGQTRLPRRAWGELQKIWDRSPLKLIVAGQESRREPYLFPDKIPILTDVITNQFGHRQAVHHQDLFLGRVAYPARFQPDLLITFGRSIISKNVKLFLRKYRPEYHWHIQAVGDVADTFQSLTHILRSDPETFFEDLRERKFNAPEAAYQFLWQTTDEEVRSFLFDFWHNQQLFSEFEAVYEVMQRLPENTVLHLANSMPVRYANFINLAQRDDVRVCANRGTSGIDGSTSTAIGHALADPIRTHVLLTGDVAFFYDHNAFWHDHLPKNLRIVLLNNRGGGIFRMIQGPPAQPELSPYFTTPHQRTAQLTAEDFGLSYVQANDRDQLFTALEHFWIQEQTPKVLEIHSDQQQNTAVLEQFRQQLKQHLDRTWKT
ncbi:MAG: 2-succinyl-5-enolpyruvyl-6-hydroxy-3-cyclohexene-1-carboxylic-acid synthase [Bernardetiaceae bacterium]